MLLWRGSRLPITYWKRLFQLPSGFTCNRKEGDSALYGIQRYYIWYKISFTPCTTKSEKILDHIEYVKYNKLIQNPHNNTCWHGGGAAVRPTRESPRVQTAAGRNTEPWSGQCLTCTFRASCCSARLSRAQVIGGGSKGGPSVLAGTREYEPSDRNRYQAEGGLRCYGIWNVP